MKRDQNLFDLLEKEKKHHSSFEETLSEYSALLILQVMGGHTGMVITTLIPILTEWDTKDHLGERPLLLGRIMTASFTEETLLQTCETAGECSGVPYGTD